MLLRGPRRRPGRPNPLLRPSIPDYQLKANLEMLKVYMNYTPEWRKDDSILPIDKKEIKSGDFIGISRFDGLDNIIMIGTGSHIGHTTIALWDESGTELYVVESNDVPFFPGKHGIQKHTWDEWIQLAHRADFNVVILPLKEELRKKFDLHKAWEWYYKMETHPYGYHNFLFSWIDTKDKNTPFVMEHEHFEFLFGTAEKIIPGMGMMMLGEGANLRVNQTNKTFVQVAAIAAKKGMTFEELLAIPEIDDWEYSDGPNYVCSSFCMAIYKAAGLLGNLTVQATEFGPLDCYQIDFYDISYKDRRPDICKEMDPDLPYCQIMGKLRVDLNGYSTVKPYDHMNEKCPSIGPDFKRLEGC